MVFISLIAVQFYGNKVMMIMMSYIVPAPVHREVGHGAYSIFRAGFLAVPKLAKKFFYSNSC